MEFKKGRGRLGMFEPLLGSWIARAASDMGPVVCRRVFSPALMGAYVELFADWEVGTTRYRETALFGFDPEKRLAFWSFTSDGKQSRGTFADAPDIHPKALAFEAQMPAGLARMSYWPADDDGFHFAVESRTRKGWNRFAAHHYHRDA